MAVNTNITNALARVVGLIAAKHPDCSIQIEWREGTPQEEWTVTASTGVTDHLYVVWDETGTWAPLTDGERGRYDRGESILTGEPADRS